MNCLIIAGLTKFYCFFVCAHSWLVPCGLVPLGSRKGMCRLRACHGSLVGGFKYGLSSSFSAAEMLHEERLSITQTIILLSF